MIITKRRPPSAGEILAREFLEPLGMTQTELADAMGVQRRLVNEIVNERRAVTVQTALLLSKVLGTTAEFWLNMQYANDMWDALNSKCRRRWNRQSRAAVKKRHATTPRPAPHTTAGHGRSFTSQGEDAWPRQKSRRKKSQHRKRANNGAWGKRTK
jgi:addiction module HigA family antidote